MKKIFICFAIVLSLTSCQQTQSQSQSVQNYYMERANFNTLPWATIDKIPGMGDTKLKQLKNEFKNGYFTNGKDFEKRMKGILSDEMIGKIGEKYDFEEVH